MHLLNDQGFSLSFSKKFQEVWSFLCTWSLERCLRMWFYELTGVFVGFDVADPIEELKLSLMRLWRYTGNFSGHTNSERRRRRSQRGARAPRVWKRKRETFILRSAQLLRGTGDYRWIFHDRKDYALEFFALYLSDFFVHTACYTDQICYCSKYGNLIQSHICKGGENDKMSGWFLENQQKIEKRDSKQVSTYECMTVKFIIRLSETFRG